MFLQVPARKLIIPGLPDLYHTEGFTAERMQQIAHMANGLIVFTLKRDVVTVVSAMLTGRRGGSCRWALSGELCASACGGRGDTPCASTADLTLSLRQCH